MSTRMSSGPSIARNWINCVNRESTWKKAIRTRVDRQARPLFHSTTIKKGLKRRQEPGGLVR